MLKTKCNGCGKTLAADATGRLCSLCSMGLTPGRQIDLAVSYQSGLHVDSRDNSGQNCPRCHAHLSVADVMRQKCAYCHATVAQAEIPVRGGLTPHWKRPAERPAPTKVWPEKAPIR